MKNYSKLNELEKAKSVCLLTHINPDADALCSAIVLRDFLKKHFNISKVDIFAEGNNLPESYTPILGTVKINKSIQNYQVAIMLDSPNTDRLGIYKSLFFKAKTKIVIDHHATNNFDGDINIVEIVSSTCEIVYSILKYYKYKISNTNKGKLYAGIITDTNNFTVGAVTSNTFKIASEFENYINREAIFNNFLGNNSLKNMQLLSLAIQNIVTFDHNQIVISHISHEEAKKFKADYNDFNGIINRLATINVARYICFIYPKDDHYYISMRGRKGADVSSIAKIYGGGGHAGAAAFPSYKQLKDIEQLILTSFRNENQYFKLLSNKIF